MKRGLSSFLFFAFIVSIGIATYASPRSERYLDLASVFKEDMHYTLAQEILEHIVGDDKDPRVQRQLAKLFFLKGDPKAALALLDAIPQKTWEDFLYQGLSYEALSNSKRAIKSYEESLHRNTNSIALYRLAKLMLVHRNYVRACALFAQLIKLDASVRLATYYLAQSSLQLGDYKQAYTFFAKAHNFYPQDTDINTKLARVKKRLGDDFFAQRRQSAAQARKGVRLTVYEHTKDVPEVRVRIAKDLTVFTFRGKEFRVTDGEKTYHEPEEGVYLLRVKDAEIQLIHHETSRQLASFKSPVKIAESRYPFYAFEMVYGQGSFWHKQIDRSYRGALEVAIVDGRLQVVNELSIEEYLYGVLPAEMYSWAHPQALRAQAVAARTIAVRNRGRHKVDGFDFCADVHCQVYQGMMAETPQTTEAVNATRGQILVHENKPIETFYHANCGGCLRSDLFGARPYLKEHLDSPLAFNELSPYQEEEWFHGRPAAYCQSKEKSAFRWQRVYDSDDFARVFGFPLEELERIVPITKGDCFHYDAVEIVSNGTSRLVEKDLEIRNFFDRLRSSAFKAELAFSKDGKARMLLLWGAGFGHGVGMCQDGAMAMGNEGYSCEEILTHYYPETEIKKEY